MIKESLYDIVTRVCSRLSKLVSSMTSGTTDIDCQVDSCLARPQLLQYLLHTRVYITVHAYEELDVHYTHMASGCYACGRMRRIYEYDPFISVLRRG